MVKSIVCYKVNFLVIVEAIQFFPIFSQTTSLRLWTDSFETGSNNLEFEDFE